MTIFISIKAILYIFSILFSYGSIADSKQNFQLPKTYPISISNNYNGRTIEKYVFNNPNGSILKIHGAEEITIQNCIFGPANGKGIELYKCKNITIKNCTFYDQNTSIKATECSDGIKIINNKFSVIRLSSDANHHFVQFDKVSGSGNIIANNSMEQPLYQGNPEDLINIYASHGTKNSYIEVRENNLKGGGPSRSSGGIMVSDGSSKIGNLSTFVKAFQNTLVNPGQYGIAIAGGNNCHIIENIIYAEAQSFTNVGIYVWDNYKQKKCYNNTVLNNHVNWNTGNPKYCTNGIAPCANTKWNGSGSCGVINGFASNLQDLSVTEQVLPERLLIPDLLLKYNYESQKYGNEFIDMFYDRKVNGTASQRKNGEYAYMLDGSDDYIEITNSNEYIDNHFLQAPTITIAAWIKPSNTNSLQAILQSPYSDGYTSGYRLTLENERLVARIITDMNTKPNNPSLIQKATITFSGIKKNQWNFIAFTYDGYSLKGYINGKPLRQKNIQGRIYYDEKKHTNGIKLGKCNGVNNFEGSLKGFLLYRGVLIEEEINTLYENDSDV